MSIRPYFVSVLLVSTAAIAYEILLIRVLSIVQWHHFAWMIISLALLGYGASGTVIALFRGWLDQRFSFVFSLSALLFSISMVACLVLGQHVPFNALQVIWDSAQWLYLAQLYILFMIPFFFAAGCIGLAFTCRSGFADRIYFFDLVGAGLGAVLVIAVLFALPPERALVFFAALALAASVVSVATTSVPRSPRRGLWLMQALWLFGLAFLGGMDRPELRMSQFKELSQALEVVGARVVEERSGPLGLVSVVESPQVPLRHAPGLSFATRHLPPDQLALYTDGGGLSVITKFDGVLDDVGFLGDVTAALPYQLLDKPRVLVLGAGGGYDVLLALHNGAAHVDAVELNPQVVSLIRQELAEWSGHLYNNDRVSVHIGEARGHVMRGRGRFDLVQIGMLDSGAVAGSGTRALSENYLYTVEAMERYLQRLEPGGLLAVTRWLKVPPRDSLKLAATAIEALRASGVDDPGSRMAIVRSWNTATLLVRNGPFDSATVDTLRQFAQKRSFDMAWYPGMPVEEANRFNRLDEPWLFQGVTALLGEQSGAFIENYKFDVSPATDQRPYFDNFFKWRALAEILTLRERGGAGLLEWGYLILIATVAQAVAAGTLFILLPLWFGRWLARREEGTGRGELAPPGTATYFFLLGLAFLLVEIAFIQKFILFLAHPLYSVAVVLAGFLVCAGLGSACSSWLMRRLRGGTGNAVTAAALVITALVLIYLTALPALFDRFLSYSDAVRVVVSLLLIAPLAFFMGMPFPLGLRRLASRAPGFIPWAWGLNGFASVVSAALATLLAVEFGINAVLVAALVLYLLAASIFRSQPKETC